MRDFAAEIGEGRFGGRLTVGSNDELAELASSLTAMSARLRDIDNDRRTFLARASHELRTPVTNVQALLEALDEGAVDDLQLRKQFLTSALKETQRMAALVRDLLNLGQLEAGMQSMEARPIDLRRLVEGTLQPLLPRLEAAGVRASIDGTEAVQLAGDPDRLQRALLNVLDNALKHAPAGSEIAVRGREAEGYAVIVVTDRGPGFSTAELPRVFEQFFTGGDGGRGSGLGLAIARTIVDAHGGTITAGNDPAGGAVITIRLPLRRSGAGGPVRDLQSRIG